MKQLEFYAAPKQATELHGLAYWIADINYLRERYGNDEPEIQTADKTIKLCFDRLDSLGVPFWVQNAVIDSLIDDSTIFENYGHYDFCNDDFFCSMGRE